jgi:hypothetical protein
MIVLTVDQVGSRENADLVGAMVERLNADLADSLVLPADRTAGDELQLLATNGSAALAAVLLLSREGVWSIGCGVGPVKRPLGPSIRESSGDAFVAARAAVDRAKKRPTRFALETEPASEAARDAEALVDLMLVLRSRRSAEGWELHDLLTTGETQARAAARLGITPQAASKRARAAELRAEQAATGALARLLDTLDTARLEEGTP